MRQTLSRATALLSADHWNALSSVRVWKNVGDGVLKDSPAWDCSVSTIRP